MPPKPKPTRVTRTGNVVPNEAATAAGGALLEGNSLWRDFAIETLLADIEARLPAVNRYVRVRDQITERFGCSRSSAERAIRAARVHLAERFAEELPTRRAEICEQLQRIADAQEYEEPMVAVAALREVATIVGLHAPKKFEVTHGATPELALQLDAIIEVLNDSELAALRIVLVGIERAKTEGRLALASGDDEAEDAEIVEPSPTPDGESPPTGGGTD